MLFLSFLKMSFFTKAIQILEELNQNRSQEAAILSKGGNTKEATAIQFKIKNYVKWIEKLKAILKQSPDIKTENDIKVLELTPSLETKLIEILKTSKLQDLEDSKKQIQSQQTQSQQSQSQQNTYKPLIDTTKFKNRPKGLETMPRPKDDIGAIEYDLQHVHGVGPKEAQKLQKKGITLDNLVKEFEIWVLKNPNNAILLPSKMAIPEGYSKSKWEALDEDKKMSVLKTDLNRRLNDDTKFLKELKYDSLVFIKYLFDVMNDRIPRNEIEKAEKILKTIAKAMNPDIVITLCGSFRRGKASSGDIDCLIAHPLLKTNEDIQSNPVNVLHQFVNILIKKGFIVDQLSMGDKKFMGFCKVPNKDVKEQKARHIDIKYIPYNSYGCAVLHFTGSANFNVQLRQHALSKGYSLNEYYLKNKEDETMISCGTEEEVFKILNYPYKKPTERDL